MIICLFLQCDHGHCMFFFGLCMITSKTMYSSVVSAVDVVNIANVVIIISIVRSSWNSQCSKGVTIKNSVFCSLWLLGVKSVNNVF